MLPLSSHSAGMNEAPNKSTKTAKTRPAMSSGFLIFLFKKQPPSHAVFYDPDYHINDLRI
jgi:hypothetical protein